jgi:hypothetical protein
MKQFLIVSVACLLAPLTAWAQSVGPTGTPTPNGTSQSPQAVESPSTAPPRTAKTHGSIGIQLPPPSTAYNVNGIPVPVPNGQCALKVQEALAKRAIVPTSDAECARAMDRALEIQRTGVGPNPEPWPSPTQ